MNIFTRWSLLLLNNISSKSSPYSILDTGSDIATGAKMILTPTVVL